MDTFEKTTEPPGRRKRRIIKKRKWPKWLRTGRVIRLILIWVSRIFRLAEIVIGFILGLGV